jgi:integrase/recombinase XerD
VTVQRGKRGRARAVPLAEDALDALVAWVKVRAACASDRPLASLPRTKRPPAELDPREIGRIVERYATAAGLPEDRRTPHVLRHTFCTHLAAAGASVEEIRELAGHADIRTTTIYTAVDGDRLAQAVASADRRRRGLGRLAA